MANTIRNSARAKSRSSGTEQSITRILDATLEALSRQGFYSLSMTDVCRIAGVARGTLYRYFPSKDALLESLALRTRQQTVLGIQNAAAKATTGREALIGVIDFLKGFADESRAKATLEVEPLFFIGFLQRQLQFYTEIVTEALGVFYEEIEQNLEQPIDRMQCSEIILRVQISYIFLPDNRASEHLAETALDAINNILVHAKSA